MRFPKQTIIKRLEAELKKVNKELEKTVQEQTEPDYAALGKEYMTSFMAWVDRVKVEFDPTVAYNKILSQCPIWVYTYKLNKTIAEHERGHLQHQKKDIETYLSLLRMCTDNAISLYSKDYDIRRIFKLIGLS
ncbi:MAG: hypothetical protein L0Y56_10105 [Nitrospira sp.]|nr:hypothetical protein [Nitrospira sp.]